MDKHLLDIIEAIEMMLADFEPVEPMMVSVDRAIGLILAKDLIANIDLPWFTDSSMDGFAVKSEDICTANELTPVELRVVADIPAGTYFDGVINNGQAARVMTGGAIPAGADSVVPVELTNIDYRHPGLSATGTVLIYKSVVAGENVRKRGQDITSGQLIRQAGSILRPQDIGMLAVLGQPFVCAHRRPKIGVLSTGDEIVSPGEELQLGKIYDSNSYTLSALAEQLGCDAIRLGIAVDRKDEIERYLDQAVEAGVDLIVSSAGVSVGAFDFVRSVIEEHGRINFWRVNMRPGKPLAYGNYRGVPIVGLPGNPVSAFIGFVVFVSPIIARLRGQLDWKRTIVRAILEEPVTSDGRESYLRSIVLEKRGKLYARLTGHQGSGNLYSLVQANALLIVPSEVKSLPIGAEIDAWMLSAT